jgi:hypothetical protein
VGRSALEIYTDGNGDDYLLDANKHALRRPGQKPLPCSCDEVDGSHMTHLSYIVRTGDTTLEIAAKYGLPESTLLRINNRTTSQLLRQGQVLDIPLLQGSTSES